MKELDKMGFSQKQRLAYIDFKLMFVGHLTRAEVVNYFEQGLSSATRDINFYKELAPDNMEYDTRNKRYYQTKKFKPLFKHDPRKTLMKLSYDITDGFDAIGDMSFPVEAPSQLNIPDLSIVAKLVQAVLNRKAVNVIYTSLSSGSSTREIVPHSIVDNGLRWHVRAYDRKTQSFRDFVLTRVAKVTIKDEEIAQLEEKQEDHQWVRIMPLQLVPHPSVKYPTAIALDYAMKNGVLSLNVRAALAGYLLRRWNVDCTTDASLEGGEYQLWLSNRQTLYGAENLAIAPGYTEEGIE